MGLYITNDDRVATICALIVRVHILQSSRKMANAQINYATGTEISVTCSTLFYSISIITIIAWQLKAQSPVFFNKVIGELAMLKLLQRRDITCFHG